MMRGRYTNHAHSASRRACVDVLGTTPPAPCWKAGCARCHALKVTRPTIASVFPGVKRSLARNYPLSAGNSPGRRARLCVQHKEETWVVSRGYGPLALTPPPAGGTPLPIKERGHRHFRRFWLWPHTVAMIQSPEGLVSPGGEPLPFMGTLWRCQPPLAGTVCPSWAQCALHGHFNPRPTPAPQILLHSVTAP